MLLPAKAEVARELRRYRARERMMLASPADRSVRAAFEESGHTLCVLMGARCAREAADAAERYLRPPRVTRVREQDDRPRAVRAARRGPPATDRHTDRHFQDRPSQGRRTRGRHTQDRRAPDRHARDPLVPSGRKTPSGAA
jgi:hypothetical protein